MFCVVCTLIIEMYCFPPFRKWWLLFQKQMDVILEKIISWRIALIMLGKTLLLDPLNAISAILHLKEKTLKKGSVYKGNVYSLVMFYFNSILKSSALPET